VARAEASIIGQAQKRLESEVAERGKIEEAVRMREQRVRLLLDSTAEAIFGMDLNGACTFANPACLRMLGYSNVEALIGMNMHSLIHHSWPDGSRMEEESCGMSRAFKDGVGVHRDDEVLWRADGTSFPAEYWSHPEVQEGATLGAVVTFLDITARMEAETALVAASRDLEAQVEKRTRALSEAHHRIMEQQLLEQDLRMAGQIQSDLLPESLPVMDGFEFSSVARPSRYLNGDFYDYARQGATYCSMMLADISGKGLSAALLAASARSLYRRALATGGDHGIPASPSAVLEELNGDMFPDLARTERFITIVAARLNLVSGAFDVANAGGCEVILFDASDGCCRTLQKGDLPIGIFAGSKLSCETVGLRPGMCAILYSDGITEAANPEGELFGLPRLLDQISRNGRLPVDEQLQGILAAVEVFQQGQPQSDDMTLIALRAKPRRINFSFVSSLDSLNEIPMGVASHCFSYGEDATRDLELAISEILANIREHGYESSDGPVDLELRLETRGIELIIREKGQAFDISRVAPPRLGRAADHGFGLHLIREVTDNFSYEPGGNDGNLWILFRSIEHGRNPA